MKNILFIAALLPCINMNAQKLSSKPAKMAETLSPNVARFRLGASKFLGLKDANTVPQILRHYAEFGSFEVPMPEGIGSVQLRNTAANCMARYRAETDRNNTAFSFRINASELDTVIKQCIDSGSHSIRFSLGANTTAPFDMALYIIALDSVGQHYYLRNVNDQSCNVLSAARVEPPIPPATFDFNNSNTSSHRISSYYFAAAKADNDAEGWINAYRNENSKFDTTHTWTYDIHTLSRYITNGKPNIRSVEFFLAKMGGKLTLIIVGVDAEDKYMMFRYRSEDCVLENANPCPYCLVEWNLEACNVK